MDLLEGIKSRRSVRKFTDELVSNEVLKEIVDYARFAPSWANTQIARYNFVTDKGVISKIASEGVKSYVYNQKTIENANGILVLSYVEGKSGRLDKYHIAADKPFLWESFDAGIACQTFCLSAHAKGVGTCIFGVVDKEEVAKIINLNEKEKVAAIIVYGYYEVETKTPPREEVDNIIKFI